MLRKDYLIRNLSIGSGYRTFSFPLQTVARPRAMSDAPSLQQQVAVSVFEALPDLQEEELVELLDFIFQQHSGGAFNPDNTPKKEAIVQFVKERPFAVSERGVTRRAHPTQPVHVMLPCALTLLPSSCQSVQALSALPAKERGPRQLSRASVVAAEQWRPEHGGCDRRF